MTQTQTWRQRGMPVPQPAACQDAVLTGRAHHRLGPEPGLAVAFRAARAQ
ncbi:hypothetical protein A6P39_028090 [Streptomyces sp. FXJ1.172]|nr:hypothetical protein [Streptomyces sp. FXJ1.172]WEO97569.1 hypothetical protein A6P39_028090 [Streptomyces sp. FXJ1.172]